MDRALLDQAKSQLQTAQRILVVSHIRPDGDAVGSLLGLGLSLQLAKKEVQMVLADGVPATFRHLPGSYQVLSKPDGIFDCIVALDSSDLDRLGGILNGLPLPDINIDHHPTNLFYAKINMVETEAVATAELLATYLPLWELPLDKEVATVLLTGIITDTLGFRTSNMTPRALRIAADLMEFGVDLSSLYHQTLLKRSFEAALYWGVGLSRLQREDRIVWTSLSLEDRKAVGYPGRDDADLINLLSTLNDVDIVILFVEQAGGKVKVSWRSQPDLDVSQIALKFGGGGHKTAAGAEVDGDLQEVVENVIRVTRKIPKGV